MSFNASSLQIYVSCLASYNAGIAHGQWLDVEGGVDSILDGIKEMLSASPVVDAEEWAIHDYNGFPDKASSLLGEHPDLEDVFTVAESLINHGEVFEAALNYYGDIGSAVNTIGESQYVDCGDSEESIVEAYLDTTGELEVIPENLRRYFDFKAYARDLRLGGDWFFERVNGTLYAFHTH